MAGYEMHDADYCGVISILQWRHRRAMASQITSLTIVYLIVFSVADQRKHQSSASLAFVRGIHRWPVNSPQNGPVTRKMFPFHDVIMIKSKVMSHNFNWFRLYNCCICYLEMYPYLLREAQIHKQKIERLLPELRNDTQCHAFVYVSYIYIK